MAARFDDVLTDRLRLRRWTATDRAPFAIMNADPVVVEHFVAPLTRAESDAAVDRYERHFDEHGFGLWVLQPLEHPFVARTPHMWGVRRAFGVFERKEGRIGA